MAALRGVAPVRPATGGPGGGAGGYGSHGGGYGGPDGVPPWLAAKDGKPKAAAVAAAAARFRAWLLRALEPLLDPNADVDVRQRAAAEGPL